MSQNHDIDRVVKKLVDEHFELDEGLEKVVWIKYTAAPEIRLIQITTDTLPTGDVLSFYFPPSDEISYPLLIAQVTPEEWERVLQNKIPLPEGWSLEGHQVFYREMVAA